MEAERGEQRRGGKGAHPYSCAGNRHPPGEGAVELKDYLRIFRRRILWFLGTSFLTFFLFLSYFALTRKPVYSARTKVFIEAPSQISLAMQIPQRSYMSRETQGTWQALISGETVRERAMRRIRREHADLPDGVFGSVSTTTEPMTSLVIVEAHGSTPEAAALLANATAREAHDFSAEVANQFVTEAIDTAMKLVDKENSQGLWPRLVEAQAKVDAIRQESGVHDLRFEAERSREVFRDAENRIRQLEQKIASNSVRSEEVRLQKAAAVHFLEEPQSLEALPAQYLVHTSPRVQKLTDELDELHREDAALAANYEKTAKRRKSLQDRIWSKSLELESARREAVGRELDFNELTLLNETRLAEAELKGLKTSLPDMRRTMTKLGGFLGRYEAAEKERAEIEGTIAKLSGLIVDLKATRSSEGYVRLLPKEEAKPGSPIPMLPFALQNWPMGLVLALVLGASVAYLRELMDSSLRTDYDVKRHLNLPVISDLPVLDPNERILLKAAGGSFLAERFDTLATLLGGGDPPLKTILVTSSAPGEGKTLVSLNLAAAFARQGFRTLLIDCDLRIPSVHGALGLQNGVGCTDLLLGSADWNSNGAVLRDVGQENLRILLSGSKAQDPYALLNQNRLNTLLEGAGQRFEVVIVDSPPVLRAGDPLKLAAAVDGTLLVVEAGRTDMREATWAKRLLEDVGAKILGVLLNKAGGAREAYYYYYYRRYSDGAAGRD